MRTTNKCFKEQIQNHIINRLDEEYGPYVEDQLQAVASEFKNWYGPYEQKQHPNRQEAFRNWMDGLPSVLNTEYEYNTVHNTMKSWFEACGETYKEKEPSTNEYQLYKNLVYRELNTLFKQNNVKFY